MFTRFLALALLLPVAPALAAPSFLNDENVFIESPLNDDAYAVGGKVTVKENIRGDALMAGGNVDVTANIQGDLTAAGGQITIDGTVGDDARIAGGEITIKGMITDDLIVTGGQVTLEKGSEVRGDIVVFGGEVFLGGTVRGNVQVNGGTVGIDGPIGGTLKANGESLRLNASVKGTSSLIGKRIILGEKAAFQGPVEYWTEKGQMDFGSTLKNTTATFRPEFQRGMHNKVEAAGAFAAVLAAVSIYWLLTNGVLMLIYVLLAPKAFTVMAKKIMLEPGKQFLWGLLFFLLAPLLGLVLFMTVIGIPLALFVFCLYAFSLVFASAFTSLTFARVLEQKYKKKWGKVAFFFASIGVLIVLTLIGLIPIIGWIAKSVLVCMAFGAIMSLKRDIIKKFA